MLDFSELEQRLHTFADERDWNQYHSPKNLAMALSVEASELLECFQWLSEPESENLTQEQLAAVADEIADVQLYLIRLANRVGVHIQDAVQMKMVKNAKKYPAKFFGSK